MVKKERTHYLSEGGIKNLPLDITVCHHSACLVMANCDPWDVVFYPILTLMMDYNFDITHLCRLNAIFVNLFSLGSKTILFYCFCNANKF